MSIRIMETPMAMTKEELKRSLLSIGRFLVENRVPSLSPKMANSLSEIADEIEAVRYQAPEELKELLRKYEVALKLVASVSVFHQIAVIKKLDYLVAGLE